MVWRRGGDGSALKSGFLIKWLMLFLLGREKGVVSAAALFLGPGEADISSHIGGHGTRDRSRFGEIVLAPLPAR